jgi:hypothetical protein
LAALPPKQQPSCWHSLPQAQPRPLLLLLQQHQRLKQQALTQQHQQQQQGKAQGLRLRTVLVQVLALGLLQQSLLLQQLLCLHQMLPAQQP